MIDIRYCTAGQNAAGSWFIACQNSVQSSAELLRDLEFTEKMSTPIGCHYDIAARHIRDHGGMFWATNAGEEYVTIAGIPNIVRGIEG
ncbi:hypothetical protein [Actibacterium lipolyticum]|uniref:Uncharacterized protein n=1 Tax=Actibacterium lipolyticum TaxID=1524263 RepID=A0A238JQ67_9RHOB|nr:hypothetical protein [Actibacterium lipolyticum]SMX32810.1 hypothetical protein COL8621_00897 [Actibacterium lipolyticum]